MSISNKYILLLILLVGAALRCYDFALIPFTHDEFSAYFRLDYDNFDDLITYGVKSDTHPAGIQVFLYYWGNLFGMEEWIVKLPFAFFGMLSIYLVFLIGRLWYNETVGLLSSACLASIQFTVMYSQIARPYISGLFLSLLMVHFLSKLIKNPEENLYRNLMLFALSAALCAYNHHFSLLFAAIASLSALFLIRREYLLRYMASGLLIFILYLPHLDIFFLQLGKGGIEGWLAKPQPDFLVQFIRYIFNFSWISLMPVLAISLLGLILARRNFLDYSSFLMFSVWFMTPFLIGYYYSIHFNAVLQYSVLIFSFPFIYFLLFGHLKELTARMNLLLVSIILTVNAYSLISVRKHYSLFYKHPYKEILTSCNRLIQEDDNLLCIVDTPEMIRRYYQEKYSIKSSFTSFEEFNSVPDLKRFLEKESPRHDRIFVGAMSYNPPSFIPLIQDYFPHQVWQENLAGGTLFLFDKKSVDTTRVISILDFEHALNEVSGMNVSRIVDTVAVSGNHAYLIDSLEVYGPTLSYSLSDIIKDQNNLIDISVMAKSSSAWDNITLVASLENKNEVIYWSGSDFATFIIDTLTVDWNRIHHSLKLSDISWGNEDLMLKIYVYNPSRRTFLLDDLQVRCRDGNPVIYGLNEEF